MSSRYSLVSLIFGFMLAFTSWHQVSAFDLQVEIDQSEEGEILVIPPGEYEGPFKITKPITLVGEGEVRLYNRKGDYVLYLETDQVSLNNLTLLQEKEELTTPALLIKGNNHQLSDLVIKTMGMGIVLEQANDNRLTRIQLQGAFQDSQFTGSMLTREGNGVDLYLSHNNLLEDVQVRHVQDGFYLEQSEGNTLRQNYVADSRYAFHLMFTKGTQLVDNLAERNINGAMIMGTEGTIVRRNHFRLHKNHVHAQGLTLYDVQHAWVTDNLLEDNLYGLYIDSSSHNHLEGNQVYHNYIGLEARRAEHNQIIGNDFVNNMISARAKDSENNLVEHNYWDAHHGLDLTGERISAIPYHADLIFPTIITQKPAFQLLADAPGLLFLQLVLSTDPEKSLTDTAPRLELNKPWLEESGKKNNRDIFLYSLALVISITIIFWGGRREK